MASFDESVHRQPHVALAALSNDQSAQQHITSPKGKKTQARQLLSCTKCRERKVKCDRTKPCTACCARGYPKDCEFVVGEGSDYSPIQQSYEIKKLRKENQRLRERLRTAHPLTPIYQEEYEGSAWRSMNILGQHRGSKRNAPVDSIYFGTPSFATVIDEFASIRLQYSSTQSLTHPIPSCVDMSATVGSTYPFPTFWSARSTTSDLINELLTSHDMIFGCLEMLHNTTPACTTALAPCFINRIETEQFLGDAHPNSNRRRDILALILATIASGLKVGVHVQNGGRWQNAALEESSSVSDVYLAASMHSLRLANFLSSPTLSCVQTLVTICPYLINSGRVSDAHALFGTTVSLAHAIGLHRDPDMLPPPQDPSQAPFPSSSSTSASRRRLWWWMLHMDQHFAVTLGRPLSISCIGDCQLPEPLATDPVGLRIEEYSYRFTMLARHILGSNGMSDSTRVDECTRRLASLWETVPVSLQFSEAWNDADFRAPEWPLEVVATGLYIKLQSLFILLNRNRVERYPGKRASESEKRDNAHLQRLKISNGPSLDSSGYQLGRGLTPRGRTLVIASSLHLLQAFIFLRRRCPGSLICWTIVQQAFIACMILVQNVQDTNNGQNVPLIEQGAEIMTELRDGGVHGIAGLAVKQISDRLTLFRQRREEEQHSGDAWLMPNPSLPGVGPSNVFDVDQGMSVFDGTDDQPQQQQQHIDQNGSPGFVLRTTTLPDTPRSLFCGTTQQPTVVTYLDHINMSHSQFNPDIIPFHPTDQQNDMSTFGHDANGSSLQNIDATMRSVDYGNNMGNFVGMQGF